MIYLLLRQQIKDIHEFKQIWNQEAEPFLTRWNCLNARLCHSPDSPNDIVVIHAFENIETAKKFINSDELKQKLKIAGVTGEATPTYLESVDYKDFEEKKKTQKVA
jgi:quinol monooxygenase YgiN